MAKNITLTQAQLDTLVANAVANALAQVSTTKSSAGKGRKAPTASTMSKADMNREDGTVRKDGMVWWVSVDGSQRKWVTQKSYNYITNRRAYASGEKTRKEYTPAEKAAYKKAYAKEWAKWQKTGKHTSEENKAMHKQIVAKLSK